MPSRLPRPFRTALFHALRTAFRLTPMPLATRDKLRQRFLDRHGDLVPSGPSGQLPTGERVHRPYVRSDERAIGYVPYRKEPLPDPLPATLVAFYLPQFHTIPENDEWWGKGFTEWRNVTRALPQFEGHHQPKLPGDLGFYDLRNPEVMREQARLAREYGISAFCFYFYWFGGKTLLETPLRNWLNDKSIDLKFCLCWANEKWSRTWDGRGDQILINQTHGPEDDIAFIEHVAEYMRDSRYLRVDGKPILVIYRPGLLPDVKGTTERWRKWCHSAGIGDIHLIYVQSFEQPSPDTIGFDGAVEFPPNLCNAGSVASSQALINQDFEGEINDWRHVAKYFTENSRANYLLYKGVNPGWDNQARRPGHGRTLLYSSPRGYHDWLRHCICSDGLTHAPSRPVFINAWNEWAEGAILEPDARLGYAFLHQTRKAINESSGGQGPTKELRFCVMIHAWYIDVLDEILSQLMDSGIKCRVLVTTTREHSAAVQKHLGTFPLECEVLEFENRGRDILPFLHACERLLEEQIDVVLKIHTKRSTHRTDGEKWRRDLIDTLLSADRSHLIMDAFRNDPSLGLVGPEGHILPASYYWGANEANVQRLLARMGLPRIQPEQDCFVSGSMFWVRLKALRPILDTHLEPSLFESEKGQIDGTLAHAIERIFAHCCKSAGFRFASTAEILGQESRSITAYPHAVRSDI